MESMTKGATKGFLEHWEEKIPELVTKLRNREIAFIQDKRNFDIVRRETGTAEFKLFQQFAPKGWLRILFKMGLALREIEKDQERVEELKNDIYHKFGTGGVHIAELAQRGIVTQLVAHLTKILGNPADVTNKLVAFLEHVDELVLFVKKSDAERIKRLCDLVKGRVDNSQSRMTIVFGSGFAKNVVLRILKCVKEDLREYFIETQEEGLQVIGFIFAPELEGRLTHWSEPLART